MKSHLLTVAILLAALACYGAGLDGGGLALFFAAAALEVWFWIRSVQSPTRPHARATARR